MKAKTNFGFESQSFLQNSGRGCTAKKLQSTHAGNIAALETATRIHKAAVVLIRTPTKRMLVPLRFTVEKRPIFIEVQYGCATMVSAVCMALTRF